MTPSERNAFAIIMAGGKGERFWPLSTEARPKQLVSIFGGKTLLEMAVERLEPLFGLERILVITNAALVEATRAAVPRLPPSNIVGEPVGRDTAAACATGAGMALARGGSAVAILTADQVIGDEPVFRRTLADALDLCRAREVLITLGIRPTMPATGFGYIETGDPIPSPGETRFLAARRFVEKPDAARAEQYVASGRYLWNAGMFVWSIKAFSNAVGRHAPHLTPFMDAVRVAEGVGELPAALARLYPELPKISIDYALMEHAGNIVTALCEFKWDDVGAWPSLRNHFPADSRGNTLVGATAAVEAEGNVVFAGDRPTVLFGVSDLVVVQGAGVTLVCPANRAQELKTVVAALRSDSAFKTYL
jgi:mannose-1-phosphate guanylyltransferase